MITDLFVFSTTNCQIHDILVGFPSSIHLRKLRGMQDGFLASCMYITQIDGIRLVGPRQLRYTFTCLQCFIFPCGYCHHVDVIVYRHFMEYCENIS